MRDLFTTEQAGVYYDPYKTDIVKTPYPVYARLRQEAPIYYNSEYDFYAISRYKDVRAGLADHKRFISGKGGILEMIQGNVEMPPGLFICEDPPIHSIHRTIVQRIFTPKRMVGMEEKVRAITTQCLDKLVGRNSFDFIADIGAEIPMRIIGALLGIPEQDFESVRESVDARLVTEEGKPIDYGSQVAMDENFGAYIDWRVANPSDDVITELLGVEFTDDSGTLRKLSREELLTFINVLAGAGNETTNKLIGWMGKVLAEHPEQRRALVNDPSLIPEAIEELLRFEPPGPHVARYVVEDAEYYGQTVPAGSAILFLVASANRDESVFPNGDQFDIFRDRAAHVSFGYGPHTCIGNVLARTEGRVVLEEILKRFPEWDVDMEHARLLTTSTVRGWETLPAYVNPRGKAEIAARVAQQKAADTADPNAAPATLDGEWVLTVKGPTGPMDSVLEIVSEAGRLCGKQTGEGVTTIIDEISYDQGQISWVNQIAKPMKMKLTFSGAVVGNALEGDSMSGKVKAGFMGSFPFTAVKRAVKR